MAITNSTYKIIQLLSDGEFHSGQALGEQLNVTRSAIWKSMKEVQALGFTVIKHAGRGYRLQKPLELLNAQHIQAQLSPAVASHLDQLTVHPSLSSTNQYLLDTAKNNLFGNSVCLAEQQTAGRGRRGRPWYSPFAQQLVFSILWHFNNSSATLAGLSIAVGVTLIKALEKYGLTDINIKWPNDLFYQDKKLAGILVEAFVDGLGTCHAVIGIGLNIGLHQEAAENISQPWIDLQQITTKNLSRNALAACLIEELFTALPLFAEQGLTPFQTTWQQYDLLKDKPITLHDTQNLPWHGVAKGIDQFGGLLVETTDGSITTVHAGEVSVRREL